MASQVRQSCSDGNENGEEVEVGEEEDAIRSSEALGKIQKFAEMSIRKSDPVAGEDGEALADAPGEEEGLATDDNADPAAENTAPAPRRPPDLRRVKKLKSLLLSKYDEVWGQSSNMGWTALDAEAEGDSTTWNICWSDTSVSLERVMHMGRMQRINHYPGMLELVRKAGTARNLNKMLGAIGKDYKFFPRTFLLPADYTELKKEFIGKKGNKTFIVKPSRGCQGKDIQLTRSLADIDPHEPNIVQRYMHRPHLLDGYKYDLRLYVLLTSVQPMRIYMFREGLVRVCTEKYELKGNNLGDACMHLTNYAINKDNDAFVQPASATEDSGSHKRTLGSLLKTLEQEGADVPALWDAICQLCVKTIISVQPHLQHTYYTCRQRAEDAGASCFELLGFDVILDHKLSPFLLEVNHSPSFTCDSPLDSSVKSAVIRGTMEMVSFTREEQRILKRAGTRLDSAARDRLVELREMYERKNCDALGFDQIFPPLSTPATDGAEMAAKYAHYLEVAAALYQNYSLHGSRRETSNCGSCAAKQSSAPARSSTSQPAGSSAAGPLPARNERRTGSAQGVRAAAGAASNAVAAISRAKLAGAAATAPSPAQAMLQGNQRRISPPAAAPAAQAPRRSMQSGTSQTAREAAAADFDDHVPGSVQACSMQVASGSLANTGSPQIAATYFAQHRDVQDTSALPRELVSKSVLLTPFGATCH